MFQCPHTGNTHFYWDHFRQPAGNKMCQCPHTGNTHFYRLRSENFTITVRVSMPSHGQHSFLRFFHLSPRSSRIVSMPSHGQHSFLRVRRRGKVADTWCQCPHTGNTHFYCTPSNALVLCGLLTLFLQVIHRIFWKRRFFGALLVCSQFVHIWSSCLNLSDYTILNISFAIPLFQAALLFLQFFAFLISEKIVKIRKNLLRKNEELSIILIKNLCELIDTLPNGSQCTRLRRSQCDRLRS